MCHNVICDGLIDGSVNRSIDRVSACLDVRQKQCHIATAVCLCVDLSPHSCLWQVTSRRAVVRHARSLMSRARVHRLREGHDVACSETILFGLVMAVAGGLDMEMLEFVMAHGLQPRCTLRASSVRSTRPDRYQTTSCQRHGCFTAPNHLCMSYSLVRLNLLLLITKPFLTWYI